jgi:hypothetical protein
MSGRQPVNLDAQLIAARELYAQAQAGCMASAAWPGVVAAGAEETTLHVLDHALRRLVFVAVQPHDAAQGREVVAGLLMLLGEHMGRLADTLGDELKTVVLPAALKAAVEAAGGRADVVTSLEPAPQQKEALH